MNIKERPSELGHPHTLRKGKAGNLYDAFKKKPQEKLEGKTKHIPTIPYKGKTIGLVWHLGQT